MNQASYTFFDTDLGRCAIVWKEAGFPDENPKVVGFQLPEADERQAEERIGQKWAAHAAGILPPGVARIIHRVKRHFTGEIQDFRDIDLDLEHTGEFAKRVYAAARAIPPGRTVTYGRLAEMSGFPRAARAVGQAMRRNPIPLIIPCHRVLASGGKIGGFSAPGGSATKMKMLQIEKAIFINPLKVKIRST